MLEGEGEPQERGFGVSAAPEGNPDGQTVNMARRYRDAGIARDGGGAGGAAQKVIAVDKINWPRRGLGRGEECIELVLVHDRINPQFPRLLAALCQRLEILRCTERPLGLRLFQ